MNETEWQRSVKETFDGFARDVLTITALPLIKGEEPDTSSMKDALNYSLAAITTATAEVIGEDEPCFRNGKQLKEGDAVEVTFATDKDMRESSLFIEANGKNNLRAEQRRAIGIKEGE